VTEKRILRDIKHGTSATLFNTSRHILSHPCLSKNGKVWYEKFRNYDQTRNEIFRENYFPNIFTQKWGKQDFLFSRRALVSHPKGHTELTPDEVGISPREINGGLREGVVKILARKHPSSYN
jgi:hypothetical protein